MFGFSWDEAPEIARKQAEAGSLFATQLTIAKNAFSLLHLFYAAQENKPSRDSELPPSLKRLYQEVLAVKSLRPAFDSLSKADQQDIFDRVEKRHLSRIFSLAGGTSAKSYWEGVGLWGFELSWSVKSRNRLLGRDILRRVADDPGVSKEWKKKAEEEWKIATGGGSFLQNCGRQALFLLVELVDPRVVFPSLLAGPVGELGAYAFRLRSMNRMTRLFAIPGFLGGNVGAFVTELPRIQKAMRLASLGAGLGNYLGEVTVYSLGNEILTAWKDEQKLSGRGMALNWWETAKTWGVLRGLNHLGRGIVTRFHLMDHPGVASSYFLAGLEPELKGGVGFLRFALGQTLAYGGLRILYDLEAGPMARNNPDLLLTDALLMQLSLMFCIHTGKVGFKQLVPRLRESQEELVTRLLHVPIANQLLMRWPAGKRTKKH